MPYHASKKGVTARWPLMEEWFQHCTWQTKRHVLVVLEAFLILTLGFQQPLNNIGHRLYRIN